MGQCYWMLGYNIRAELRNICEMAYDKYGAKVAWCHPKASPWGNAIQHIDRKTVTKLEFSTRLNQLQVMFPMEELNDKS